ncbi:ferritin-like domain-containing protein [Bacillus sp. SG-1]|uniref:ferritin-like domain-containing protein n=1 Tax=Bacillus sp. SG-1 TaxID=161544 RepID=UPI0001543783|nr:ferritin-like domain-containing protein [Bacillus sp. SG-1]EDL66338.1 Ferritin and Dps [Bacillus sp. SG-1]
MPGESVIKTLNEFLRGQYMGIHAYEHLIEKIDDSGLKQRFQEIQQNHKQHAMMVAERIQKLNGTPVDDEGTIGKVQGYIGEFMIPDDKEGILQSALKGESYYGIEISEEMVKGDLDPESRQIIEKILDEDREHVKLLESIIH